MKSVRVQRAIPSVLTAITAFFTIWNRLRPQFPRGSNPAFLDLDWQLSVAFNAPAAAVWESLKQFLGDLAIAYPLLAVVVETAVFLILVYLAWLLVVAEGEGRCKAWRRHHPRLGIAGDVLAAGFGIAVARLGRAILTHEFPAERVKSALVSAPHFIWAMLIVTYYPHLLLEGRWLNKTV